MSDKTKQKWATSAAMYSIAAMMIVAPPGAALATALLAHAPTVKSDVRTAHFDNAQSLEKFKSLIQKNFPPPKANGPTENEVLDIACPIIMEAEGFRGAAYPGMSGGVAIGFGFTADVHAGDTMSREEAEQRLRNREGLDHVRAVMDMTKNAGLSAENIAALASARYNMGGDWLDGRIIKPLGKGTMSLNEAAEILLSCHYYQDPQTGTVRVAEGLSRRRKTEAALLRKPAPIRKELFVAFKAANLGRPIRTISILQDSAVLRAMMGPKEGAQLLTLSQS